MSEIALYNLLKRIPHATDGEIEKAVSEVARSKNVATKLDILKIEKVIAESEARLIAGMYRINNHTNYWVLSVGIAMIIAFFLK